MRESKLYYGKQYIDEDDIKAVSKVLESDFLTTGPKVAELEKKLCDITGAGFSVAVSSGTAALHCACIAAEIGPGDEVITSPLTFAASANCILYCGGIPVFADVDINTYNIDPDSIRKKITKKTKAIIAVDFTGQAANLLEIRKICDEYNLIFIEDAAHSIGTVYFDKPVGSIADMTCFSFHPVKTVTSGEGGAITTNDEKYFKKLMLAHTHGVTHDEALMMDEHEGSWEYEMISLGYNYRITDFQSALLLSQIKKLDWFKARRKAIAERYNEAFLGIEGIILQKEEAGSDTCRHLYTVRIDEEKTGITRKTFFEEMDARNIRCQVHYIPVYWFPFYRKLGYRKGLCPNAERVYKNILSLPIYPGMKDGDVEDVIVSVTDILDNK